MPNSNKEIVFPDETVDIISEIVRKYKLDVLEEELTEKIAKISTLEEKREIFESLPICQISGAIKEIGEGKTSIEDLPSTLQNRLNISKEIAEKITSEIKERIIPFISRPYKKKLIKEETPEIIKEKESILQKRDSYREPIE